MEAILDVSSFEKLRLYDFDVFEDRSSWCCKVDVVSGHFSCENWTLYFDGFQSFLVGLEKVYATLNGEVDLNHSYEEDFIKIRGAKLGKMGLLGEFYDRRTIDQALVFGFEFDQSYLPAFLDDLRSIARALES